MNTNLLIPGLALAVGLGVGFGLGSSGKRGAEEIAAIEMEMRTRSADRGGMDSTRVTSEGKKVRSLDEIYRKPGQSNRVEALLDFYSNLSPEEFAIEAEKLDGLPFNERLLASVLLFGKWAEVDPTAAMAFTDTMGFSGAFARPTILQGWASMDPVNAAKYYTENPAQFSMMNAMGGRGRGMGAQGPGEIIASEWAKQDPTAALAWASGLKVNSAEAMTSVISEVAKSDPMKAANMVGEMAETDRGKAYESIAKQWAQKNFTEASAWAAGLPDGEREMAMSAAIQGLAQSSPALAALEIGKMTDADARRDAVPIVAKNFARMDAQASMDWLDGLDDDAAKRDSMRDVMSIWAVSDSEAALKFIKSQQSPDVKDRAAETYVWSNRTAEPAKLVEVAGMISDPNSRMRTTGIVASRWMQEDAAAATQFIQSSDVISDRMKERILSGQPLWGRSRN